MVRPFEIAALVTPALLAQLLFGCAATRPATSSTSSRATGPCPLAEATFHVYLADVPLAQAAGTLGDATCRPIAVPDEIAALPLNLFAPAVNPTQFVAAFAASLETWGLALFEQGHGLVVASAIGAPPNAKRVPSWTETRSARAVVLTQRSFRDIGDALEPPPVGDEPPIPRAHRAPLAARTGRVLVLFLPAERLDAVEARVRELDVAPR